MENAIKILPSLLRDFQQVFPHDSIEAVIHKLLEDAIRSEKQKHSEKFTKNILEKAERIRNSGPSVSNDEIRALRNDGRP